MQYGCGFSDPQGWMNFDSSPSLRIQRIPLLGPVLGKINGVQFPKNVRYGDIIKGLPVANNSCDGVYCSHVLEHLSLNDFRTAVKRSYEMLAPGGTFRLVMPDLEVMMRGYLQKKDQGKPEAAVKFIKDTLMGTEQRSRGMKGMIVGIFGNANHLWLWDHESTIAELEALGFSSVRRCAFNDSADAMFARVESEERFQSAVCLEAKK